MQPVLPIGPFQSFPFVQLVKITFPMVSSTPGVAPPVGCIGCGSGTTGVTGTGDLQVFDLVTIKQSWGRWGFGPALVFPTASANSTRCGQVPDRSLGRSDLYRHQEPHTRCDRTEPDFLCGLAQPPEVNQMIITPDLHLQPEVMDGLSGSPTITSRSTGRMAARRRSP